MKPTAVIYGSSTGTCQAIAETIANKLGLKAINVTDISDSLLAANDNLLLGTSTWGAGELQDDWQDGLKILRAANLNGKTVAIFGCGDSESYPDTFCSAMRELYDTAKEAGANVLPGVDAGDYQYEDSEAVIDGHFVGLAIDDMNESDKTEARVNAWLSGIVQAL